MKKRIFSLALMALLAQGFLHPNESYAVSKTPSWAIAANKSAVAFGTNWAGQNVGGSFAIDAKTSKITFDPKNLGASSVNINIAVNSLQTASKEARENLPLSDWLNFKAAPIANYSATSFKSLGNDKYVANGFLTLKGARYALPLNFTLKINNGVAIMDGSALIDRLVVKVGKDSDGSAEWVDKNVRIVVRLIANKL